MHSACCTRESARTGLPGGTALLTAVGNAVEPHARTGAALVAAAWLTVAVKLAVSALGVLAIVRSGSSQRAATSAACPYVGGRDRPYALRHCPDRGRRGRRIRPGPHGARADLTALRWHALLSDPWFLLSRLLLMTGLVLSHPHTAPTTAIPPNRSPRP